jgi:hypothetical protein
LKTVSCCAGRTIAALASYTCTAREPGGRLQRSQATRVLHESGFASRRSAPQIEILLLALGNLGLSLLEHAQNGFFQWTEWIPVAAGAFGTSFLLVAWVRPDPGLLRVTQIDEAPRVPAISPSLPEASHRPNLVPAKGHRADRQTGRACDCRDSSATQCLCFGTGP